MTNTTKVLAKWIDRKYDRVVVVSKRDRYYSFVVQSLKCGYEIDGCTEWQDADDWTAVGRVYDSIVAKANNRGAEYVCTSGKKLVETL